MLSEAFEAAGAEPSRLAWLAHHWETLAREAVQPNVFYEHWSLLAALQAFAGTPVRLLLVWEDIDRHALLAVVPLCVERGFRGLPIRRTALWRHPYCYLCTPLLRRDRTAVLWPEILRWIREDRTLPAFTSLYRVGAGDDVVESLTKGLRRDAGGVTGNAATIRRATLRLEGSTHAMFLKGLRTKKRKEWSRHWRRLAELGDVRTTWHGTDTRAARFDEAVERFLALENASWKRKRGTSLLSDPIDARFFRELLANGHRRGQAAMLEIALDDESIGMIALLVSACGRTAYTLKIATSARYPQHSLGSQVVLRLTARAYAELPVATIDSCAAEDHPMIDRIWTSRREIVNLHFANGGAMARMLVPVTDLGLSLLRRSRWRTATGTNDEVNER